MWLNRGGDDVIKPHSPQMMGMVAQGRSASSGSAGALVHASDSAESTDC